MNAQDIVASGYDAMAERYAAWQSEIDDDPRTAYVERLLALLPTEPDILEMAAARRLVAEAGLSILESQVEHMREPESEPCTGPVTAAFHWLLAQKS